MQKDFCISQQRCKTLKVWAWPSPTKVATHIENTFVKVGMITFRILNFKIGPFFLNIRFDAKLFWHHIFQLWIIRSFLWQDECTLWSCNALHESFSDCSFDPRPVLHHFHNTIFSDFNLHVWLKVDKNCSSLKEKVSFQLRLFQLSEIIGEEPIKPGAILFEHHPPPSLHSLP